MSDCYLPRVGGIELQVHNLASRQHAIGHDVTVVTSVPASPAVCADSADARHLSAAPGVLVHRPSEHGTRGADGVIRYACSLSGRSLVLAGEYDVVHVHASTFSPLAFLSAPRSMSRRHSNGRHPALTVVVRDATVSGREPAVWLG